MSLRHLQNLFRTFQVEINFFPSKLFDLSTGAKHFKKWWQTFNSVAFLIFETISDDAVDNDVTDDDDNDADVDPTQPDLLSILGTPLK